MKKIYNYKVVDRLLRLIPDKLYISLMYLKNIRRWPDINHPKTFTEKLQWLKLYNRKREYIKLVDKYAVKNYVSKIIGEEYIIPTLAMWNSVDEIDITKLPNQFVLKWNHDSGSIILCKDKSNFNIDEAKERLRSGAKRSGYWYGREWPYKQVKPCVIAEKYMVDESGTELKDYKFFCFNGMVNFFKIDFDRYSNHRANYYNLDGKIMPFGEIVCPPDFSKKIEIPANIKEMVGVVEKLSHSVDSPFLRIDLYNVNGNIYFGEITLYPASGFGAFTDMSWDDKLGEMLALPEIN